MKKAVLFCILITFYFTTVYSQWTQMTGNDLEDCNFRGMLYIGGNIIGYGEAGGIFKSVDKGKNWSFTGYGLDSSGLSVRSMGVLGSVLYALQDTRSGQKVFKSTNNGLSWSNVTISGLPNYGYFSEMGSANSKLFVIYNSNDSSWIYYSTNGNSFSKGAFLGIGNNNSKILSINSSKLFIVFNNYLFYTTTGITLDTISSNGLSGTAASMEYNFRSEPNGNYIYGIDNNNVVTYDFVNKKWNTLNPGFPVTQNANSLAVTENIILLTTVQFVPTVAIYLYRSLNHGANWTEMKNIGIDIFLPKILIKISDSTLVASCDLGQVCLSEDTGRTWKVSMTGLHNKYATSLAITQNKIFTTKQYFGFIRSDDGGTTWTQKNKGLVTPFANMYFGKEIFEFKSNLYSTIESSPDGPYYIYKSTDIGENWSQITGLPSTKKRMNMVAKSSTNLIMSFFEYQDSWKDTLSLYYITNNGSNWTQISGNFYTSMNIAKVLGMMTQGNEIFMFARLKNDNYSIFYSPNLGSFWNNRVTFYNYTYRSIVNHQNHNDIHSQVPACFIPNTGKILFALSYNYNGTTSDSLYILDGLSLIPVNLTGLPYTITTTRIDYYNGFYYLCTTSGVYATKNLMSWSKVTGSNYFTGVEVSKFETSGHVLYLGTRGNGLWTLPHQQLSLGNDVNGCLGDSVMLTATGPNTNFTWCCGLGTSKTVKVPVTATAVYTASATDVFGFSTTDTVVVTLNPKPGAGFTINDDEQCMNSNNFIFTNTSTISSGSMNYNWTFGDGGTSTQTSPVYSYSSGTAYDVKLLVTSDKGCKDSVIKKVTLIKGPDASITLSGDSVFCEGGLVTLYANTGTNMSYQWMSGSTDIPGATTPYHVEKVGGNYKVRVTDNTTGCFTISNPVKITVNTTNFNLSFTGSPRFFTSPPFNVAFDNLTPSPSNYNWLWLFGDNSTSTTTNPFHSYTYNGDFTVTLIAQNKTTGCYDTFTREAYVSCSGGSPNPCPINPVLKYSGSLIICEGDSLKIQADTGTNYTYIWQLNSVVLNNETKSFIYAKENGQYRVLITNPSCSLMSYPIVVSYYYSKKPEIKSNGKLTPCTNDSMELFVTNYFPAYKWSTGQTTSKIYIKNSGDYRVTVTDAIGCKVTSDPFLVNKSLIAAPQICLVTVDPNSRKNLIAWERPNTKLIDYYNVYKETFQANVYEFIGRVDYDSVSVFIDTASVPAQRANRYRITLVDTCNTESSPGPNHKTIHLSANKGVGNEVNLIWSHYEGFTFSSYKIYRGTSLTNLTLIDSIPSNLNSYTDLNPPIDLLFYMVTVVKLDTCYPAIKRGTVNSGPFSQSTSNIKDYNAKTPDYLEVSQKSLTLDSLAGSVLLTIFTNKTTWSASADQSWLTLTPDVPNKTLNIEYSANHDKLNRTANITVKAQGLTDVIIPVIQNGTSFIAEENVIVPLVFPNPAGIDFYIMIPEEKGLIDQLELYDINGKLLLRYKDNKTSIIKVTRNELPKGLYFIKLKVGSRFINTKIVLY